MKNLMLALIFVSLSQSAMAANANRFSIRKWAEKVEGKPQATLAGMGLIQPKMADKSDVAKKQEKKVEEKATK